MPSPSKVVPCVDLVKTNIAADVEVDFNDQYDKEHIPAVASVPGGLQARRFLAVDGQPRTWRCTSWRI
jgi:hypothetical protein